MYNSIFAKLSYFLQPEWKLADPICTFVFAILVLITTINILKDALSVLMEGLLNCLTAVCIFLSPYVRKGSSPNISPQLMSVQKFR